MRLAWIFLFSVLTHDLFIDYLKILKNLFSEVYLSENFLIFCFLIDNLSYKFSRKFLK